MIEISRTAFVEVAVVKNRVFEDERGFFMESYNKNRFVTVGLPGDLVQDNDLRSIKGVMRGLHHQYRQWPGQLVATLKGAIFDVALAKRPKYSVLSNQKPFDPFGIARPNWPASLAKALS